MELQVAPAVRRSAVLSRAAGVGETVGRLFRFVNDLLPIGKDLLEWTCASELAELLGGPRAAKLLRSRLREMELPGSRFGHIADKDIVSCEVFVRFVAETLRSPPADAWEALETVCGITQLYRLALAGANSDGTVTWQQLEALFPALQATRSEDKKSAAKIWRAISPRGDAATLPMMLHGVLMAQSASPAVNLERDLAAAYSSFRARHLRAAAAALTVQANPDVAKASYVLSPGYKAGLLEVLCAYTGQRWLALSAIMGMNKRHAGYLLKSVGGTEVGGEDPALVADLMQKRPVELIFVDITDGILGDARFAALLENRNVSQSQLDAVATMESARKEAEDAEDSTKATDTDAPSHGCSQAVESLVQYTFREIGKVANRSYTESNPRSGTFPPGYISAKVAALAVHCLNHSIRPEAVVGYLKKLHDSGSGPGDPEDAEVAFSDGGLDSDPYSDDEGYAGREEDGNSGSSKKRYEGVYEVVNPLICRKEPSRRSPVTAEFPKGHRIRVTTGVMLRDHSVRLCCENGWISTHSQAGQILVRRAKDDDEDHVTTNGSNSSLHRRMSDEADKIPVHLETFMCLVGGAEKHRNFSFTDMLKGLREVMAAATMFRTMDMYNTGRVTIVEFSILVQELGVSLEVQQVRDLWSHVIGDEDHSAKNVRSIDFAGLLEGMEDVRRISMDPGATTERVFRGGVLEKHGPGSHVDRLLRQFLTSGFGDETSLTDDDVKVQQLFRHVFDVCDRASKASETTGFVDARIAALIIHSAVHAIDYDTAMQLISKRPVMTNYVDTFKRFQRPGMVDLYTDEDQLLREEDEEPKFVYAGEYIVGDGGVYVYKEASSACGYATNDAGEACKLMPGERVVLAEGQCVPIRKNRDADGTLIVQKREFGKLMLRYPGDWLSDNRGWIDPIGDDGKVCLARVDGKSFEVELEAVDAEETLLRCEQSADKVLVDFGSLSRYLKVAQRNSSYTVQRFMWGMHEVLAAATLFRACDTRFLGRIALVDLSWVCSQLKLDFTIEELTGIWRHLASDYDVISFAQFLEGAMALRNAAGSLHMHAIRKFRRQLLTRNGPGRSVESMIAGITDLRSVRMATTFEQDEAGQEILQQKKGLIYVAGVGFRPKKIAQAEQQPEYPGSVEEPSDAAAEAAALAAKANPHARKSYKSGNKWHQTDTLSPRPSSPRAPKAIQPEPAEQIDAQAILVNRYARESYTEMLVRGATTGNLDSVRAALSSGADVSFAGSRGRTPLITAAIHGHADVVAELVAAPVALIDVVDFVNGWTALMYAGRWGLEDIVQLLLDSGADIEVTGNDGSNVRDLAYDWGYNNITGLLDKHLGLDVELPGGGDEIMRAEDRALIHAVGAGDLLAVMDALTDGADADCEDSNGNTPLIVAINAGRSDIVAILLDDASLAFEGAAVDRKGVAGWTPFMYACRWGQLETMALLIANGADVSVTGEDGSTARSLLYEYGHDDLVESVILLKGGSAEVAVLQ